MENRKQIEAGVRMLLLWAGMAGICLGDERPSFDVASIKPTSSCVGDHQDEQFSPGRVSVTCITLPNLIQAAYGTFADGLTRNPERLRLVGVPEWARLTRYNVIAQARGDVPLEQMFGPMLQLLLEDRFRLQAHREVRELPVYAMTVAKSGLKTQRPREGSCVAVDLNHANERSPDFCGRMRGRVSGTVIIDDAYGMGMPEIASRFLANRVARPVIDKTGIAGLFDAHLEFVREDGMTASEVPAAADAGAPSFFTAVEEQLGLKLSPDKGPVEVLVIDQVKPPSAN